MRLAQVPRQSFVGIDLRGQELGPARLPLSLPVFWSAKLFWRRVESQIATVLAVRELTFVVSINDVVHYCALDTCIYKICTKMI